MPTNKEQIAEREVEETVRLMNEELPSGIITSSSILKIIAKWHLKKLSLLRSQHGEEVAGLKRQVSGWEEDCRRHTRNEFYLRGLIEKIAEPYGILAMTSDDGSVQQDVICLKVPELVNATTKEREELMLRSVAAMSIAEGDFGHESLPITCPMLAAVKSLRENYNLAHSELGSYVSKCGELQKQLSAATEQNAAMREAIQKELPEENLIRSNGHYGFCSFTGQDPTKCQVCGQSARLRKAIQTTSNGLVEKVERYEKALINLRDDILMPIDVRMKAGRTINPNMTNQPTETKEGE